MNLYYVLNKNINIEKLSNDINSLIQKFIQQNGGENLLLSVEIKKINLETNSLVPKLDHKIS